MRSLKRGFFIFAGLATVGISTVWMGAEMRARHVPPVAGKVIPPASDSEAASGIAAYGKYSFELSPTSKITDMTSRRDEWVPFGPNENILVRTKQNGIEVEIGIHPCFECGNVSGGTLKMVNGDTSWRLGFHHVGAESVIYTDHLPPSWVLDFSQPQDPSLVRQTFIELFGKIYAARIAKDEPQQLQLAEDIVGLLIFCIQNQIEIKMQTRS